MSSFGRTSTALDNAGGKPVLMLAASMLASATGSNLLLIALAVHFFQGSGSALSAAGVYVAQFLPVIVLMPIAWRICDRLPIRTALVRLEIGSAVTTLLVGLAVTLDITALAYALLFVRGFFDMTTKAARSVAVKSIAPEDRVPEANNLVNAANYVGQCLGAFAGFALISIASMMMISIVNALTLSVSAGLCSRLIHIPAVNAAEGGYRAMLARGKRALASDPRLLQALVYLVGCVIFLQGFNQVSRLWIPLAWLGLPASAGAISEAVGVAGIVAGLAFVSGFMTGKGALTWPLRGIAAIALVSMLLPFATQNYVFSFAAYFVFMFMFEVTFMMSMNGVLTRGAREDIPCIMVMFYGFAFGGMTLSSLLIAAAADLWGLPATGLVTASLGLLLVVGIEGLGSEKKMHLRGRLSRRVRRNTGAQD